MARKTGRIILGIPLAGLLIFAAIAYATGLTNKWADSLEASHPGWNLSWLRNASGMSDGERLLLAEQQEAELNAEAAERLRVNLTRDQLLQNRFYTGTSDLLYTYSFTEFDATRRAMTGFSDAVTLPFDLTHEGQADFAEDILWQAGTEWMHNPVSADMAAQVFCEVTMASTGQSLGRDINPFIGQFVDTNTAAMRVTEVGYRGWETWIRERQQTQNGALVVDTTGTPIMEKYLIPEYRETVAFMTHILDNLVYVGETTQAPLKHWPLHSEQVFDAYRRTEASTSPETKLWYLFAYLRKDGRVEFLIGFNKFDRRMAIFPIQPVAPATPVPVDPTPTAPVETPTPTNPPEVTPTPVVPTPTPVVPTPTPVPPTPTPVPPTPTPVPPTPTPVPPTPEPTKNPDDDRVVDPEPGDQGTGPADVTQTEEPARIQPTEPPAPSTPPRTVEEDRPSQQTPASTPAPTAVVNPQTEDCYVPGSEIRDDQATPPPAQSVEEGTREVQTKPPEVATQPPVTDTTVTEDDFEIPFD